METLFKGITASKQRGRASDPDSSPGTCSLTTDLARSPQRRQIINKHLFNCSMVCSTMDQARWNRDKMDSLKTRRPRIPFTYTVKTLLNFISLFFFKWPATLNITTSIQQIFRLFQPLRRLAKQNKRRVDKRQLRGFFLVAGPKITELFSFKHWKTWESKVP